MINLLLAILASPTYAKDKLIIGVESNDYYPHYQFINDELNGFARDLLDLYASENNLEIEYRSIPLKRLIKEVRNGRFHFKYPDNPKWNKTEKEGMFQYTKPIVRYIDGTMVLDAYLKTPIKRIKRIGTLIGFTPWPYFDLIDKGEIEVIHGRSLEGIIQRTLQQGNDAIYANIDVALYQLSQDYPEKTIGEFPLKFDSTLPFADSYYALSTVKYPGKLKKFEDWMLFNRDKIQKLEAKHGVGEFGILSQFSN